MGTRIFTNVDSLRGLFNLQKSNALQSQTLTRLSSGTQINSAADNPSGLIGSQTLQSQITAIQGSITNSNRANNVIGTADAGLAQVGNLLDQIRGLVQSGVNTGALSSTEIAANQAQIDQALGAINRIASNTSFAGSNLLDGSKAFTTVLTAADAAKVSDYSVNEALFGSSPTVTLSSQIITAAKQGVLTYNAGNLTAATTLEVAGAKGSQVLFFGNGTTYTNINSAINNVSDVTGVTSSITTAAVASTLQVGTQAANNGIAFTDARQNAGASDTPITIQYVVAGNNTLRSIAVNGTAITINLATTGVGAVAATETGTNITSFLQTDVSAGAVAARALVSATNLPAAVGGTGAGLEAATAATALAGGVNATLTLTSSDYGSKQFTGVNVLNGSFVTYDPTSTASYRNAGADIVARINGQNAVGNGLQASIATSLLNASVTFNAANNIALQTANVTVTGGGSLYQIGANVATSGQIGEGITSVSTARLGGAAGKLYQLGTGGGSSLNDVSSGAVQGSTLVTILQQAADKINTLRARLGAVQSTVIATNVTALQAALTNVTDARSQLADTDFAAETANLTKSQILTQAGISTLQIANSAPQQVLSLLQGH